jgi:hypothetical protein
VRTSVYTGKIAGVPVALLRPANWDQVFVVFFSFFSAAIKK